MLSRVRVVALGVALAWPGAVRAQAACTSVGAERWAVKTMAPTGTHAHRFDTSEFAALPIPTDIQVPHDKMLDTRYPTAIASGLHEGSLVRVRGWVQKIKTSSDDCDYHIEITPDQNSNDGMVIVEVPAPDASHVTDPDLRQQLTAVRAKLYTMLKLTKEPSSGGVSIGGRAYMEFSGALFFDGPHSPNCDRRGTRPPGAATCWEVHPVTGARFVKRPGA
jgi:hypothetical protein